MPVDEPELQLLHEWMDSWRGIGDVVTAMTRQGWDLQLTEYDGGEHWRDRRSSPTADARRADEDRNR